MRSTSAGRESNLRCRWDQEQVDLGIGGAGAGQHQQLIGGASEVDVHLGTVEHEVAAVDGSAELHTFG